MSEHVAQWCLQRLRRKYTYSEKSYDQTMLNKIVIKILPLLLRLLQHLCDESRPTRLMRSPESRAVVAVEVFVEGDVVAPERVVLEGFVSPEDRAISVRIQQENSV